MGAGLARRWRDGHRLCALPRSDPPLFLSAVRPARSLFRVCCCCGRGEPKKAACRTCNGREDNAQPSALIIAAAELPLRICQSRRTSSATGAPVLQHFLCTYRHYPLFFLFFLEEKERKCLKKKRNIGARCGQHLDICTEAHAQRTEGKNPATSLIRTLYFGSLLVRPFVCERSSHSLLCCIAVAQKAAVTPDALSGRQQGEFALQLALPYCSVALAICLLRQDPPAQLSDPTGPVCIGRSPVF